MGYAKTYKRQLVDFKEVSTPWLIQYPAIKKEVEKIIEENKKSITKDAKEVFKEFPLSSLLPHKLYITELRLFKPYNQDIVSVRMVIYTYTGGAHGGKDYYSWNWSKIKNKFLSLDEVITSKQFEALAKQTRKILLKKQKQDDKYDEYRIAHIRRGASRKKDFKIWNFDKNGIIFVFPEYQVASYAAGSFEVSIPLDSIK